MGHPGQALQTQRYMARSTSSCLRRPLQSPGGRGYPLHHSSSPGPELGVARAWVCRVFYRGKHLAFQCILGTSGAPRGAPTYNQTVSQATKRPQLTRTVQLCSIERHFVAGHGENGGHQTGSPLRGGGVPPRRYHTNGRCGPTTRSPEELLHRSGAHTMLRARMVPACMARVFTDRGSSPQVPHSGHRGRGWRSRRHANSRCGPTTKSPEELLHRSGAHTMLHARMVPTCAVRAYSD